jgi:HK97 family phage major capsid protein
MSDYNALVQSLTGLTTDMKGFRDGINSKYDALQRQTDAIDAQVQRSGRGGSGGIGNGPSGLSELKRIIVEGKESFEKHGRLQFEVPSFLSESKTTISSAGLTSTEPASGIQGAGRYAYRLRSLFHTVPTSLPTIGVLRSNVESFAASPQVETSSKAESTCSFTLASAPVQTFASYINFSKQALDDLDSFEAFISSSLLWDLSRKAESEILSGSGTGVHLTGLMTSASAFDTTILSASLGWNRIDYLGAAAVQLQEIGYNPDFAVVSPRNWFTMTSLRSTQGEYVLEDPRTKVGQSVYNLTILPSPACLSDTFLVGDSSQALIRSREKASVLLSSEHSDNFIKNIVTALVEERFGLQTLRPDAFVTGSLASSPA